MLPHGGGEAPDIQPLLSLLHQPHPYSLHLHNDFSPGKRGDFTY